MTLQLWAGIIGTLILGGFIINGLRLSRGPDGHAANAGRLHVVVGVLVLPVLWLVVAFQVWM